VRKEIPYNKVIITSHNFTKIDWYYWRRRKYDSN